MGLGSLARLCILLTTVRNAYEFSSTCRTCSSRHYLQMPPTDSVETISSSVGHSCFVPRTHTVPINKGGCWQCRHNHMDLNHVYYWLIQSERRKAILADFDQPLTATQIARRTRITLDSCLHLLWGMLLYGVLFHLNPATRYNRLYWLSELGKACQRKLRQKLALKPLAHRFPSVPWDLYSSVCYSHRTAVLKAMRGPMQSAAVKRRAVFQNPRLRMSANNVRDVMRYLLSKGIVRTAKLRGRSHPRYKLTDLGKALQELLVGAKVV